jgi:signal transduction histidine kinase/ActR/RegA family two-component response regulator
MGETTSVVVAALAALAVVVLAFVAWSHRQRENALRVALEQETHRRELAEAALSQSQRLEVVGRLTGGIAHDFNNQLTVISSNIELLQRRLPADAERLARHANLAMAGVQRAAALAHRLLALSRRQPLEPEPLDVGQLVAGMSDLVRRTLGEAIDIQLDVAPHSWQVRVDGGELETALLRVAVNARDRMPHGGRLTIGIANTQLPAPLDAAEDAIPAGDYVTITVADSGHDVTQAMLRGLLEPSFDAGSLGLSMVYGFIRQSGGYIDIASGQGTTVTIYLPRFVTQEEIERARALTSAAVLSGQGQTILVVEDDEAVRKASTEALREVGYDVIEAADAMEGVGLIVDHGSIDLLFTDVGLPGGVSGRTLADAARRARPGLRVLFTTGYTAEAVMAEAAAAGMHFIAKPFSLAELASKVREVLAAPAAAPRGC